MMASTTKGLFCEVLLEHGVSGMVDYEGDLPDVLPPIIECMVTLGSSLLEPLANSQS